MLAVTGLEIVSISSPVDTDGGAGGGAHVSVEPGATVTATFKYNSTKDYVTNGRFFIDLGTTTPRIDAVLASGKDQTATLSLVIPEQTAPGNYSAHVHLKNDGPGTSNAANDSIAEAIAVILNGAGPWGAIDVTAPVITKDVHGTLGNNGWYTSDVTVDWAASDAESTPLPGSRRDVINSDTPATTLSFSSTSVGGTATDSLTIKRDATAPVITAPENMKVVYGTPVTFSFIASDATSGLSESDTHLPSAVDEILKVGTYVYTAKAQDNAGNVSTASFSVTVEPRLINGNILVANKVYDGTTAATIVGRMLDGVVAGDDVSIVGGSASFSDKNAGVGKAVTATGLILAGADAANYTVDSVASTVADIAKASVTAMITANNKVYDGTTEATIVGRTLDGVVAGDDVSVVGGSASFSNKNAGVGKAVTATGLILVGADAANYTVNSLASTVADIARAKITAMITAHNKVYDGTTEATIIGRTLDGVVAGDDVSVVGGSASFSNKNAGVGKAVTATGLILAGADAANYTVNSLASTVADIARAKITAMITATNKVYDTTAQATLKDKVLQGVFGEDRVELSVNSSKVRFTDPNVGVGKNVTATDLALAGLDADNYELSSTVANTLADITARELSAWASTQSSINISKAGTISFTLANVSGLAAGDTRSIYDLFNGAKFTLQVGANTYSVVSTASVDLVSGAITVSWRMSQELYNDLRAVLGSGSPSAKTLTDLIVAGQSLDGNYQLTAEAITQLFQQGKILWS